MTIDVNDDVYVLDIMGEPPYSIKYTELDRPRAKFWVASCPIAMDVYDNYIVTVDAILGVPVGWMPEFKFGIAKNQLGKSPSRELLLTSAEARPYVPDGRRGDVIDVVVEGLRGLIGRAQPVEVMRQIKEPHKPTLRVHDRISDTFAEHGYEIEYRWPEHKGHRWVHVRRT